MPRNSIHRLVLLMAIALTLAAWIAATNWRSDVPVPVAPLSPRFVEKAEGNAAERNETTLISTWRSTTTVADNAEHEMREERLVDAPRVIERLTIRLRRVETGEPVREARVRLTSSDHEIVAEPTGAPGEYAGTDLRAGVWSANVDAPGFHPATRTIQLGNSGAGPEFRAFELFPLGDSFVFARPISASALERATRDDARSLSDLLPARYFSAWSAPGASGAASAPLSSRAEAEPTDSSTAAIGPVFQSLPIRSLLGADRFMFGWLSLRGAPAAWVEFRCADLVLGRSFVRPEQSEITVDLDLDALLSRLPSLALRVTDWASGARPEQARVRLGARPPARNGPDLGALAIAPDGAVCVSGLEAGRYDLTITALERRAVRREVTLEFGQALDLGVVVLEPAAAMRVLVVDAQGRPLLSTLQAAPYDPASCAEDLFVSNTRQTSLGTGVFEVAAPAGSLLLRATMLPSIDAPTANHHSQVILVEPEWTSAELRIVVQAPVLVEVARTASEVGIRIRVLNEYGVRILDSERTSALSYLQPGRYLAEIVDANGVEQGSRTFEVAPDSPPITLRLQ